MRGPPVKKCKKKYIKLMYFEGPPLESSADDLAPPQLIIIRASGPADPCSPLAWCGVVGGRGKAGSLVVHNRQPRKTGLGPLNPTDTQLASVREAHSDALLVVGLVAKK